MTIENIFCRLNELLALHDVSVITYFDRIHIYLDSHTRNGDIRRILSTNENNEAIDEELSPNSHLNQKLKLFQPELSDLKELYKKTNDHAINYVEFACDYMTTDVEVHHNLECFFNKHLVHKNTEKKSPLFFYDDYKKTVYFKQGSSYILLTMYSDKPARKSKNQRMYCLHLEYRLKTKDHLKNIKIVTLKNLLNFNHNTLWHSLLDLRSCNKTEFGRLLIEKTNPNSKELSRKTYGKHGNKELDTIDSLQSYLAENAHMEPAFKAVKSDEALHNILSACLS